MTSATAWSVSGTSGQGRQPGQLAERGGVGGGQHGQHRPGPAGPHPGRDPGDVGRAGVVDVVEDHQLQPVRLGDERVERGRRAVADRDAPQRGPVRELGHEAGLAEAGAADDQAGLTVGRGRLVEGALQPGQLLVAADAARHRAGQPLRHGGGHDRAALEPPVAGEHGELGGAQLRARLDAEVLDQPGPGLLVGGERLGLLAQPVQAGDQLGPEPLPVRVLGDQQLQLADERGRAPWGRRRPARPRPATRPRPGAARPAGAPRPGRTRPRPRRRTPHRATGPARPAAAGRPAPAGRCPGPDGPRRPRCSKAATSTMDGSTSSR